MSGVDEILALQKRLRSRLRHWGDLDSNLQENIDHYGDQDDILARLSEISASFLEIMLAASDEHPKFDQQHDVRWSDDGRRARWKLVPECADCQAILSRYGRVELLNERNDLLETLEWMKSMSKHLDRTWSKIQSLANEIDKAGRKLPLPGFHFYWNEEGYGYVGFITQVGEVDKRGNGSGQVPFAAGGKFVNYEVENGTARAIFDDSWNLVAYREAGRRRWTVMRADAKPRITTRKGWYSQLRKTGTIELMVDRQGNFTRDYPHVHVIHDSVEDEIRIVASLRDDVHAHIETLPGTASGNEVNAAIERAIELL